MRRVAAVTLAMAAVPGAALVACSFDLADVEKPSASPDTGAADQTTRDGSRPPDAPPPCIPSGPESCSDGIDNDCNGFTDCEDPACGGVACSPPLGWSFVYLDLADTGKCPPNFGQMNRIDFIDIAASQQCTCNCAPACTVARTFTGFTCNLGPQDVVLDAGCNTAPPVGANLRFTATPNGACGPGTPRAESNGSDHTSMCRTSLMDASCQAGQCTVGPTPACVTDFTEAACPPGFPVRYLTTPNQRGLLDTRVCPACSCGPTGACAGSMLLYSENQCASGALATPLNGNCTAGPDGGFFSYRANLTDNGCAPLDAGKTIEGGLTFDNVAVAAVCCAR